MTQPQYGPPTEYPPPPSYGQPQPGYPPTVSTNYGARPDNGQSFGIPGAVLAIVGAILVLLSFTALKWFHKDLGSSGTSDSKFSKLHDAVDQLDKLKGSDPLGKYVDLGISHLYYGWLGWALFAVGIVLALLAVSPIGPGSGALRALGVLVGVVGAAASVWAIDVFRFTGPLARQFKEQTGKSFPSFGTYLSHSWLGAWAAVLGFLLIAAGAALGPARANRTPGSISYPAGGPALGSAS